MARIAKNNWVFDDSKYLLFLARTITYRVMFSYVKRALLLHPCTPLSATVALERSDSL